MLCRHAMDRGAHLDGQVDGLTGEEGTVDDGVPVHAVRVVAEAQNDVAVNREGLAHS